VAGESFPLEGILTPGVHHGRPPQLAKEFAVIMEYFWKCTFTNQTVASSYA